MDTLSRSAKKPQGSSNRSFGLVMAVFFCLVWAYGCWKAQSFSARPWLGGISLGFLFCALVVPSTLTYPNKAWTAFGLLLHKIMSPLMLGVMFFGIFTPVGLLMRLTGRDPLHRKPDPKLASYWIKRGEGGNVALKNQF